MIGPYILWERGYNERQAKIMACNAGYQRKLAACQRVWRRMLAKLNK